MTQDRDPWQGILAEGERILWQGRPDGRIALDGGRDWFRLIFGLFFAGFALMWMIGAAQAGGLFWMVGLIHFGAGMGIALWPTLFDAILRRHSYYTLTSQRTFIGRDLPLLGRRLDSWQITPASPVSVEEGNPGSVWFAAGARQMFMKTAPPAIGFRRISEARAVYQMITQIQKGQL